MTRAVSNGYAVYALLLLCLANIANYGQRMVVSILLPAIKTDVALTDAQLGLLMGGGFAIFYAIAGVPLARLRRPTWARAVALDGHHFLERGDRALRNGTHLPRDAGRACGTGYRSIDVHTNFALASRGLCEGREPAVRAWCALGRGSFRGDACDGAWRVPRAPYRMACGVGLVRTGRDGVCRDHLAHSARACGCPSSR